MVDVAGWNSQTSLWQSKVKVARQETVFAGKAGGGNQCWVIYKDEKRSQQDHTPGG